jgi:hypothetical protein
LSLERELERFTRPWVFLFLLGGKRSAHEMVARAPQKIFIFSAAATFWPFRAGRKKANLLVKQS